MSHVVGNSLQLLNLMIATIRCFSLLPTYCLGQGDKQNLHGVGCIVVVVDDDDLITHTTEQMGLNLFQIGIG